MKILYVFTSGRKVRLHDFQSGKEAPLEFLFGLPYLQEKGYKVDIIELTDLHPNPESHEYKSLYKKNVRINKRTSLTSSSHFFIEIIEQFNCYDLIIAGNEYIAFGLAYYKQKGILRPPMLFFVMGMLAKILKPETGNLFYSTLFNRNYRFGKKYYQDLIECSQSVVFLGKGEYDYAVKIFSSLKNKFHFIPFSIDTSFWLPAKDLVSIKPYVLFIGNDAQRDFELVTKIAEKLNNIQFKFVTKVIRTETVPRNVELLSGDWKESILSDIEIRKLIQKSRLVILPLKKTFQPSGQSVALQTMACGKPVIISKTDGFWDPENFIDKRHVLFVYSNSIDEWCAIITEALNDKKLMAILETEGRKLIFEKYDLEVFGKRLYDIIKA
ncbi:MAG: glycosyltransferase family 4 protein [Candidatus Scalindua sp.]|nr:glycosyltransferase family 4 protein [Candidatus Scalindua sp.]